MYATLGLADITWSATDCLPGSGVTAFPNCNYLDETEQKCAALSSVQDEAYIPCLCNQPLFNAFYGYFHFNSETFHG
jgi:hypothetical protein